MKIASFSFVVLSITCLIACNSQPRKKTDRDKYRLHGNVKEIKQIETFSSDTMEPIAENTIWEDDQSHSFIARFDGAGNITERIDLFRDGRHLDSIKFNYDKSRHLVNLVQYDGLDTSKTEFTCDSHGNIIRIQSFSSGMHATFTYNEDGNCVSGKYNWGIIIYESNQYNSEGDLITSTTYRDGKENYKETTKYDDNHNVVEIESKNGDTTYTTKYKYEFDERGNWIRRSESTCVLDREMRSAVYRREITYY